MTRSRGLDAPLDEVRLPEEEEPVLGCLPHLRLDTVLSEHGVERARGVGPADPAERLHGEDTGRALPAGVHERRAKQRDGVPTELDDRVRAVPVRPLLRRLSERGGDAVADRWGRVGRSRLDGRLRRRSRLAAAGDDDRRREKRRLQRTCHHALPSSVRDVRQRTSRRRHLAEVTLTSQPPATYRARAARLRRVGLASDPPRQRDRIVTDPFRATDHVSPSARR